MDSSQYTCVDKSKTEYVTAERAELEAQKMAEYNSITHWYTIRRNKIVQELHDINTRYEEMLGKLEDKYNMLTTPPIYEEELEQINTFIPFVSSVSSTDIKNDAHSHFPPEPRLVRQRAVRPEEAVAFLEEFEPMEIDFAEPRNVVYNIVSDDEDEEE